MANYLSLSNRLRKKVRNNPLDIPYMNLTLDSPEWEDAYAHLRQALNLPTDEPIPKLQRPSATAVLAITDQVNGETPHTDTKRKAPDGDTDMTPEDESLDLSKRPKTDGTATNGAVKDAGSPEDMTLMHARATAMYIPFLSAEQLVPPKLPTREEMEQFLLDLRKRALVEEYFGEQDS